jgi:hypothetical protein
MIWETLGSIAPEFMQLRQRFEKFVTNSRWKATGADLPRSGPKASE